MVPKKWTSGPFATLLTWETVPINTFLQSYDYTITLILKVLIPKEIGPEVLDKKIFKYLPCIFLLLSLLGKGYGPSFEQTWIPFTNIRMLCAKFCWNWPGGSGEEDFKISTRYFPYSVIISPWKRVWPFIWTNLNSFFASGELKIGT